MRKSIWLFIWLAFVVIIGIGFFLFWFLYWRYIEYTNDAYVGGNQVYIEPLRDGFITKIRTDDTYLVKKGQLLVRLDRTDSRIALAEAKVNLAKVVREICQSFHQVFIYQAEIAIQEAELIKAQEDFQHRYSVLSARGVSLEDYQHAVAALRASKARLKKTKRMYKQALSFVQGTSIRSHPLVRDAAQKLRYHWVQLYRCNIYSPVEGLVAQRKAQVGMWVKHGSPLMSVIPLNQIWLNANYKETQLKQVRIGQPVKVTSDLYGRDVVFHGRVAGLPGAAGNAFSLLPPENLSGNWIKIVQRLPLRVDLRADEIRKHPLRIGLSMESIIDLREKGGLMVPTSSKGSPHYQTQIFKQEERGVRPVIQAIITANLDPSLGRYADQPLQIKALPVVHYSQNKENNLCPFGRTKSSLVELPSAIDMLLALDKGSAL